MGLSLLYLVTVKRRLCQMNQPNNYADKNICLKSPTAWGTVPPNVGFHSPRQGEIFQSCIFHLKRSSNGLEFIDYIPPALQLSGYTSDGDDGENWDISSLQDRFEGLA